ncbi:hypothetical protein BC351_00975 [Paenibacillus ferrarius]|uniref:Uncharacterized protein n=1 Tax=Paenibacillus ferrarius TaxID=1469647 RepID=A0A1V4HTE5_9BACL|nr:hypothetical protein [Paenibacillus ferrarius]OPH61845.1 hypothetical protein BC351_00975 [Paenibacillus ferrarius]
MELDNRQKYSLLQAVNDKLFILGWKISDYEKLPESKGLNIVLRDVRNEIDDLKYVKAELEKDVYRHG